MANFRRTVKQESLFLRCDSANRGFVTIIPVMEFDGTLKDLGEVDSSALAERILAFDAEHWRANQYRQNAYSVHEHTESLVMVFCTGWPEMSVSKESAWEDLQDLAVPLMQGLLEAHYPPGGTIIRAMAAKLKPGGIIAPHRDSHPSFVASHRIHVPITTNAGVRFMIDGRPHRFELGHAYEINNQRNHSVMNSGQEDRITFIFDYLPRSQTATA
jgi:hypothetical protein